MIVDYQHIQEENKFVVSYINGEGKIDFYEFDAPENSWKIYDGENTKGKKLNWDGRLVTKCKMKYMSKFDVCEFLYNLSNDHTVFELNIPRITSIDIEVEVIKNAEFKDFVDGALGTVFTIAIAEGDSVFVFGLKELSEKDQNTIQTKIDIHLKGQEKKYKFKYIKFDSEFRMLNTFFNDVVPRISLQTGWNYEKFDWTYLVNRANKLNIEIGTAYRTTTMKTDHYPYHVLVLDMQNLFGKLDVSYKPHVNLTLEWVSETVLGVTKIQHDLGLNELYEQDYNKYVFYNAIDACLVDLLNKKLQMIEMVCAQSNVARIPIAKGHLPSYFGESLVTQSYLDVGRVVVYEKRDTENIERYKGAFVKDLEPGFYEDVMCIDASSMYPTIMRGFNISPMSYVGNFSEEEIEEKYMGDEYIRTNTGAVYYKEESPLIKRITKSYNERLKYKSENKEIHKILQTI